MSVGKPRVACLVALHLIVFFLIPTPAPSNSQAIKDLLAEAPSATEIGLFEELIDWIGDGELDFVNDYGRMRQTVRARPASFDVFRSYLDDSTRHQRLDSIPYGTEIRQAAERHGVDGLLVAAIIRAESSFNPCAISTRGAVGLMQVMPATAGTFDLDQLTDPERNIDLGTRYLRGLLKLYEGNLELALAGYNAGPANVRRFGGLPPFRETHHYIERVLTAYVGYHQDVWQRSEVLEVLGLTPRA